MKEKRKIFVYILVFFIVFAVEIGVGYYVCVQKGLIDRDSIARIANAFYVLYNKPVRLSSIGFIWNPLPSLLEIPLVFVWRFFKINIPSIIVGIVLTAFFAAGNAVWMVKIYQRTGKTALYGVFIALLYAFNPYFFVYGFNGMSETIYIFMILWALFYFINWMENSRSISLYKTAFALAFAFLTRYEAGFLSIGFALAGAIITIVYKKKEGESRKELMEHVLAVEIVLLLPFVYSVFIWIVANWIIMGDPLYFTHSMYSNTGQMTAGEMGISGNIVRMIHGDWWKILVFMFHRLKLFLLPFAYIVLRRIVKRKIFKADFAAFLCIIIFSEITQLVLLFGGMSAGWLRFFVYPFSIGVLWLGYEIRNSKSRIEKLVIVPTLLILSGFLSYQTLVDYEHYYDSFNVCSDLYDQNLIETEELAKYMDQKELNGKILLDTFHSFNLFLNTSNPDNYIITSSLNFQDVVQHPEKNKVEYIIVPDPENAYGRIDAINVQWEGLYEGKVEWCQLEKQIGIYRIFKCHFEK